MKTYRIRVDGRVFEVRLLSDPWQETVQVEVDDQVYTVDLEVLEAEGENTGSEPVPGPQQKVGSVQPPVSAPQVATGRTVTAPLPGVVKQLAVQPGEKVTPGATLLVIEAMKMDNIIRASREGVVDAIHVVEGHRVAHGEPILDYRD
jgi:biotin carboxyl carrier protein